MPDSNELETLQARVAIARAQIAIAVQFACREYNHGAPPEEVEEFTEQIIALLLVDNCRKVRTHDPGKASFKTWLQHVVNHHVSRQLQKNHAAESLEDELLNTLSYGPTQDKELLRKERLVILNAAIDKLSPCYQRIARLKLREVPNEEIAQELNIKPASVEREWRIIKIKLAQIVADGRQSKAKQSRAKQSKDMMHLENFCNIFLYWHPLFRLRCLYKKRVMKIISQSRLFGNKVFVLCRRTCLHQLVSLAVSQRI